MASALGFNQANNEGAAYTSIHPPDRDKSHHGMYALGATVTVLSIAAYLAPFFVLFPLAAPIQIVALGVLTAVVYGVVNDQIACRQCIEYFTVGHTKFHKRLLETDNPTLNGVAWGIHATWNLGLIAGVAMAQAARATKLVALSALSLTPVAVLVVISACICAHIRSKKSEAQWKKHENKSDLESIFNQTILPNPGFHLVDLKRIPIDKRAAYMGVGERNTVGYIVMPASGLIMVVGSIAVRVLLTVL
jgi:hypothetical protein